MEAAFDGGPVPALLHDADLIFMALHGGWGEDGWAQGRLEEAGIRFTGADSTACAAAWHKERAQAVLTEVGVPVTERALWPAGTDEARRTYGG